MQMNRLLNFKDEEDLFYFNDMKINRWRFFTEKGHLFKINGMQLNRWQIFTNKGNLSYIKGMQINQLQDITYEGHPFYIQPPWYGNKQVVKSHKKGPLFYINGMQETAGKIIQIKGIFLTLLVCK